MPATIEIYLDRPIGAVSVLEEYCDDGKTACEVTAAVNGKLMKELRLQKNAYSEVCRTLEGLAAKLGGYCEQIFTGHKEDIAKLSVEIARKILMRKISEGDYEIEAIVKEALKNAPARQDLIVHLNPKDLDAMEKVRQNGGDMPAGIKFEADDNVGCAECVVESPKGTIKSLIEEHLEQIGKALNQVE